MPGRSYSSTAYKYGFNGKENDDEVKGVGNSLDFGARVYDSRLGRWLSLDPLQAKYPFASPYNFCLNTPIRAFDPDGRVVTYADEVSKVAFNDVYNLASPEFKAKLDVLKQSEVVYHVNVNTTSFASGIQNGQIGEVSYEFHQNPDNSRVMVQVASNVSYKLGTLSDELTGASQFEEGKLGFALLRTGTVEPLGYDRKDELETKANELQVTETFISQSKGTLQLDADLSLFKQLTLNGTPEEYFNQSSQGTKYTNFAPDNTPSYGLDSKGRPNTFENLYGSVTGPGGNLDGFVFKANRDEQNGKTTLSPGSRDNVEISYSKSNFIKK
jgi:RHS repeat-associated protein